MRRRQFWAGEGTPQSDDFDQNRLATRTSGATLQRISAEREGECIVRRPGGREESELGRLSSKRVAFRVRNKRKVPFTAPVRSAVRTLFRILPFGKKAPAGWRTSRRQRRKKRGDKKTADETGCCNRNTCDFSCNLCIPANSGTRKPIPSPPPATSLPFNLQPGAI